jgi:VWFA-related protein
MSSIGKQESWMFASHLPWICIFCLSLPAFARHETVPVTPAIVDNRVTLDVVVHDKSGKPVAGLQQQNFTILDNKQPQKILSFQAVSQAAPADAAVEIVLVIDEVNTAYSRVAYERQQIDKLLKQDGGSLAWPVSIALFTDAGLQSPGPPSRDGNALVAYLDKNQNGLRVSNRSQGEWGAVDRAQLSLNALGQLAEYEANRPGRKIVIWISPGWALLSNPNIQLTSKDQQGIFNSIVATSTELWLSRIALYSVDPLGTSDAGGFRTFAYEGYLKGVTKPSQVQFGNLALGVLAVHSGGRVLNSSNDVAGEIEACFRDANAYYVLSYDSTPPDGPNEYHAIEVKVDQPQLKAQTRSGFYGQPLRLSSAVSRNR